MKLNKTSEHLELIDTTSPQFKPVYIDFLDEKFFRRQQQSGFSQHLARACGVTSSNKPFIVDATAGLATDTFILASLGCEIICIERNDLIAQLIIDALERAQKVIPDVIARIHFIHGDAKKILKELNQQPNVIYLDPMYPHRNKTALVKKEMRILRELVGADDDAEQLFEIAYQATKNRVVVKRHRLAKTIVEKKPTFSLTGKNCRFDVYEK